MSNETCILSNPKVVKRPTQNETTQHQPKLPHWPLQFENIKYLWKRLIELAKITKIAELPNYQKITFVILKNGSSFVLYSQVLQDPPKVGEKATNWTLQMEVERNWEITKI